MLGRQYQTDDAGIIDILAIKKDKSELLVIELKKDNTDEKVIGQIKGYIGYITEVVAEPGQKVRGIIIAREGNNKLNRALSVTENVDFYRYKNFLGT